MMTARVTLAAIALVAVTTACNSSPELDTRTFELQYLDAYTAASLIEPYVYTDREGAAGTISTAGDMVRQDRAGPGGIRSTRTDGAVAFPGDRSQRKHDPGPLDRRR
jgi:hypothetical protein